MKTKYLLPVLLLAATACNAPNPDVSIAQPQNELATSIQTIQAASDPNAHSCTVSLSGQGVEYLLYIFYGALEAPEESSVALDGSYTRALDFEGDMSDTKPLVSWGMVNHTGVTQTVEVTFYIDGLPTHNQTLTIADGAGSFGTDLDCRGVQ